MARRPDDPVLKTVMTSWWLIGEAVFFMPVGSAALVVKKMGGTPIPRSPWRHPRTPQLMNAYLGGECRRWNFGVMPSRLPGRVNPGLAGWPGTQYFIETLPQAYRA